MNIVVCVKQTPDTAATVTVQDGKVSWGEAPLVLNPWDEFAVEQALRTKEAHGGKVTAVCLGPETAKEALKQALAMGSDAAVLISDPAFAEADSLVVSAVLAAAIRKLGDIDVAFFGRQAVDSDTGLTGAQVARRLGWPSLSLVAAVRSVDPAGKTIDVDRMLEEGRQEVRSQLPAVLSVVKELNEPRYPSFMGIRKASKAEIPVWSAADLGMPQMPAPALEWPEVISPPKVDTKCEIIQGDTPDQIAERLVGRLLEEKVL
ncbi:MAG TPA: electron transfer flavoprotein subunit beta/FixA family protein [Anaerolineales bacterium]|nr:electron transfer flavoprotein subunit beta/FixA family protein [Anaerolineales bacterium]